MDKIRLWGVMLVTGMLLLTLASANARATARVALVIGNSAYTDTKMAELPQAKNDAQGMETALKQFGFQVTLLIDADKRMMVDAVARFRQQLRNDNVALFYFSGHGLQENGINYLIPLASGIKENVDVPYKAVSANWVLDSMEKQNKQGVNIMILDACRNPFPDSNKGIPAGLAPMKATGSIIAYATASGQYSYIAPGAMFSLYTGQLLKVLHDNPCQKISDLFLNVADLVAGGKIDQKPYLTVSPFVWQFQFAECDAPTPRPTLTPEPKPTPPPRFELIVTDGQRVLSPVNGVYTLRVGETVKLRITNVDRAEPPYEIRWQGGGEKGSGRLMLPEGETNMYTAQRRGNDYVRVRVYQQGTAEAVESLFVLIRVL